MRSPVALLCVALVFLALASPGVEAIAGCLESCPDEASGQEGCVNEVCCSCCVHAGPLFASLSVPAHTLDPTGRATPHAASEVPPGRSSDILHVPKLSAA
jgi:hypothetical protein